MVRVLNVPVKNDASGKKYFRATFFFFVPGYLRRGEAGVVGGGGGWQQWQRRKWQWQQAVPAVENQSAELTAGFSGDG